MTIKHLQLHHFRNFVDTHITDIPGPGKLLVAAAPNATGKTNFLESIVVWLRGRSWRGAAADCIQWGHDSFIVRGEVEVGGGSRSELAVRYHLPTRRLRIEENGRATSPVNFYKHYPLLLFTPEDAFLLIRGPEERRTFMNHVLISSPKYLTALVQYYRVLKQRNAALKSARSPADIEAWTALLVSHAEVIWGQRQAMIAFLDARLSEHYQRLTGQALELAITLKRDTTATELNRILVGSFKSEQRYRYTLFGPHHDDFEVRTSHGVVRSALSRGQLRGVTIALKLAASQFLKHLTHEEPILLLDDILSELDEERQLQVLQQLPDTSQILLTCTHIPEAIQSDARVYLLDVRSLVKSSLSVPLGDPALPERIASHV